MRAFAVFMMIQGHTIDALLHKSFYDYSSPVFQLWQIGRGLTAPIFLFGSGFAYVIANTRKSVGGRLPGSVILKRVRWIGALFFVGVLMHFPMNAIGAFDQISFERWQIFYHVDVLRLIAVSLLGLLVLFIFTRSLRTLKISATVAAVLIVAVSPIIDNSAWASSLPAFFSGYLTFKTGSYFPLFPFSAYLFAGAASAAWYKSLQNKNALWTVIKRFGMIGATLVVLVQVLSNTVFESSSWVFTGSSPLLFLMRLGIVFLLWSGVGVLMRKVRTLPKIVPIVGQHTLFIYVFHVVILYGSAWAIGLRAIYGKELDFLPVLAVILTLLVICSGLAYALNYMKQRNMKVYKFIPYAGIVLLILVAIF